MTTKLKIDFVEYAAAKYAVEHWHYSRRMPTGKMVRLGVWENDQFIGVVIFSRGATGNIGRPYGLPQTRICELTRIALRKHVTPVTRIVRIALKELKRTSPGMELVVSYADADQGHTGAIYRAGNWIYEGLKNPGTMVAFRIHGKRVHPKTLHSKYGHGAQSLEWIREHLDPNAERIIGLGKHKYLYPLTGTMRATILSRAGSVDSDTSDVQSGMAGANPSPALNDQNKVGVSQ